MLVDLKDFLFPCEGINMKKKKKQRIVILSLVIVFLTLDDAGHSGRKQRYDIRFGIYASIF